MKLYSEINIPVSFRFVTISFSLIPLFVCVTGKLDSGSDQKLHELKSQLLSVQTELADLQESHKQTDKQLSVAKEEVSSYREGLVILPNTV